MLSWRLKRVSVQVVRWFKRDKEKEDDELSDEMSPPLGDDCFSEDLRRNPCLDSLMDYFDQEEKESYEF